jgi:methyltransferase (TIGR00027 family)
MVSKGEKMNTTKSNLDLSGVEETALLTLYAKANESRSNDPILKDERAEELAERMDQVLKGRSSTLAKQLVNQRMDPRLVIHIPLRSRKYDEYAGKFLEKHPKGVIVNLGCGMDTRFFRVDNGSCRFFDIDLPAMIGIKRQLVQETDRYRMIGQSVLEWGWMDSVESLRNPVIFLAEGVFMYLPGSEVRSLVLELQRRFPESELVCELTNRVWVDGFWGKIAAMKMKHRIKMAADAGFKFGVSDPRELEKWNTGIDFLEQWFYMDTDHPKLGWIKIFRNLKFFRNAQFTARYQLHLA